MLSPLPCGGGRDTAGPPPAPERTAASAASGAGRGDRAHEVEHLGVHGRALGARADVEERGRVQLAPEQRAQARVVQVVGGERAGKEELVQAAEPFEARVDGLVHGRHLFERGALWSKRA